MESRVLHRVDQNKAKLANGSSRASLERVRWAKDPVRDLNELISVFILRVLLDSASLRSTREEQLCTPLSRPRLTPKDAELIIGIWGGNYSVMTVAFFSGSNTISRLCGKSTPSLVCIPLLILWREDLERLGQKMSSDGITLEKISCWFCKRVQFLHLDCTVQSPSGWIQGVREAR